MIIWYFNYAGDRLIHEYSDRKWFGILCAFLEDIKNYRSYYQTIYSDTEGSKLLNAYVEFIQRTMSDYMKSVKKSDRITDDELFYITYVAYGNVRMVKRWVENRCPGETEAFAAKLISAYPEQIRSYFE